MILMDFDGFRRRNVGIALFFLKKNIEKIGVSSHMRSLVVKIGVLLVNLANFEGFGGFFGGLGWIFEPKKW